MRTILMASLCLALPLSAVLGDEEPEGDGSKNRKGVEIDPRHRYEDTVKNKDPRFYIWHDSQSGWNVRCAALAGTHKKFSGTIEVIDGTFDKIRGVGLETKKGSDQWQLDGTRTKLTFDITTKGSHDGFEFTTKGNPETRVRFALKVGNKPQPDRIFIGKNGEHPERARFSFPAKPK